MTDQIMERMRTVLGVETDYKLAKALGKSTSALSNWRKRGSIPIDECISLSVNHGVSMDWLIFGKSESGGTDQAPAAYRIEDGASLGLGSPVPGADAVPVAMYDIEAAAGAGRFLDEEPVKTTLYFPADQLSSLGLSAGRVAGVQVRGDSMESTLEDGDWVLVNLGDTDYRQEGVFLLLISGERRIKRVQRLAGGALYLISDNDHYRPEMIPPDQMSEVEILGRCVVRIGRIS